MMTQPEMHLTREQFEAIDAADKLPLPDGSGRTGVLAVDANSGEAEVYPVRIVDSARPAEVRYYH